MSSLTLLKLLASKQEAKLLSSRDRTDVAIGSINCSFSNSFLLSHGFLGVRVAMQQQQKTQFMAPNQVQALPAQHWQNLPQHQQPQQQQQSLFVSQPMASCQPVPQQQRQQHVQQPQQPPQQQQPQGNYQPPQVQFQQQPQQSALQTQQYQQATMYQQAQQHPQQSFQAQQPAFQPQQQAYQPHQQTLYHPQAQLQQKQPQQPVSQQPQPQQQLPSQAQLQHPLQSQPQQQQPQGVYPAQSQHQPQANFQAQQPRQQELPYQQQNMYNQQQPQQLQHQQPSLSPTNQSNVYQQQQSPPQQQQYLPSQQPQSQQHGYQVHQPAMQASQAAAMPMAVNQQASAPQSLPAQPQPQPQFQQYQSNLPQQQQQLQQQQQQLQQAQLQQSQQQQQPVYSSQVPPPAYQNQAPAATAPPQYNSAAPVQMQISSHPTQQQYQPLVQQQQQQMQGMSVQATPMQPTPMTAMPMQSLVPSQAPMPAESGACGPFTVAQWQELEQQALVFKYLVAGAPVPLELVTRLRLSVPPPAYGVHSFQPMGGFMPSFWGPSMQVDLEPFRCRRTDGKKWRCSREVVSDQKYCERHLHRGRSRARKLTDKATPGTSLVADGGEATTATTATAATTATTATTGTAGASAVDGCLTSAAMESADDRRGTSAGVMDASAGGAMEASGGRGGGADGTGTASSGDSGNGSVGGAAGAAGEAAGVGGVAASPSALSESVKDRQAGEAVDRECEADKRVGGGRSEQSAEAKGVTVAGDVRREGEYPQAVLASPAAGAVAVLAGALAGGHPPHLALPPPAHAVEGQTQQVPQQQQQQQQQQHKLPQPEPLPQHQQANQLHGLLANSPVAVVVAVASPHQQPQQQQQSVPASVQMVKPGAQLGQQESRNLVDSMIKNGIVTVIEGERAAGSAPMEVDAQKQGNHGAANKTGALQAKSEAPATGCNEGVVIADEKGPCLLASDDGAKMGLLPNIRFRPSPNCVLPSPFHGSDYGSGAQSPADISPLGPVPVATTEAPK